MHSKGSEVKMAYDLTARLSLKDDFSNRLRRATQQLERTNKRSKELKQTMSEIGSRANSSAGSISSLAKTFVGLGAAIGGAVAAKKLFDKTIGAAATYEQSEVTIKAMFRDDAKAADFMARMDKLALDSPLLNSQDIFGNSKSFISFTKNVDQLERLFKLSERLAASNPSEGTEGAVFAMAEMLSGDAVSMVERFRLPRTVLNEIKNLPIEQQIIQLDKLLDKMGFTKELVKDMGNTSLGLWNQIKEKSDVVLRTMGQPALSKIRDFLDRLNNGMETGDKSGFVKYGQDVLSALANGFISGVEGASRMISGIINSPEFINAEGVGGKAKVVFNKFYEGLNAWLDEGGRDKIQSVTDSLVSTIVTAIENNTGPIVSAAINIGSKIGSAVARGIADAVNSNPIAKAVMGAVIGGSAGSVIPGVGTAAGAVIGGSGSLVKQGLDQVTKFITPWDDDKVMRELNEKSKKKGKKYASGLSYVPYNGYQATLHKGERILTPEENASYGGGIQIAKLAETVIVREEADIERIAWSFVKKLQGAV